MSDYRLTSFTDEMGKMAVSERIARAIWPSQDALAVQAREAAFLVDAAGFPDLADHLRRMADQAGV